MLTYQIHQCRGAKCVAIEAGLSKSAAMKAATAVAAKLGAPNPGMIGACVVEGAKQRGASRINVVGAAGVVAHREPMPVNARIQWAL